VENKDILCILDTPKLGGIRARIRNFCLKRARVRGTGTFLSRRIPLFSPERARISRNEGAPPGARKSGSGVFRGKPKIGGDPGENKELLLEARAR